MSEPSVVIFGAGSIGRSLLAELTSAAGRRPVLVEPNAALVAALGAAGRFEVRLVGQAPEVRTVSDFDVLHSRESREVGQRLRQCEFAATAVGGENLPALAPMLAEALKERTAPLNILLCENWPHADRTLSAALASNGADAAGYRCVQCSVERMARGVQGSVDVFAESVQTVYVDSTTWAGPKPEIPGLLFTDAIDAFYARKIYTNNAGHALLAYLGAARNCRFLYEALALPEVRRDLLALLDLAGQTLVRKFAMDPQDMRRHLDTLVAFRFADQNLADTVARVARDPIRKLGPHDRLVGLIRLLQGYGLPTAPVSLVIAAALRYNSPDDSVSVTLQQKIAADGPGVVLQTVCGLAPQETCYREVLDFFEQIKHGGQHNEYAAHLS
jgi:mannitol-1-phosphate 5-dehydrogenase